MASQSKKCIVVGIGNPLLTDERAGLEVVERLKSQNADVETATRYPAERDVLDVIMGYEQPSSWMPVNSASNQEPYWRYRLKRCWTVAQRLAATPGLGGMH
jgi:hypothetical protein